MINVDRRRASLLALLLVIASSSRSRADGLSDETQKAIHDAAAEILAKTGAPSASIAIVKDGRIAWTGAFGTARPGPPPVPALPSMRYSIGSISKQFTAAALLLLAEEGKISLDDRVVRWLPDLTRAKDVSIRALLSMTSGYQDYWPQDYVMPPMLKPVTAPEILAGWARKPLDFEPGTKWQYSNTNYVIAGLLVEKASGMPLLEFLRQRVFTRLGMKSVVDSDVAALGPGEPMGMVRHALGPLRPAPKEGAGWLFAAGELAMTAEDLARWDVSIIDQTILQPSSYRAMETEVPLASGVGSRYGLGVSLAITDGRRVIAHGGEVSGFTAQNAVFPDERAAVVVFTNLDATNAAEQIVTKTVNILFAASAGGADEAVENARRLFEEFQKGKIDRALFTANANAYFDETALKDFASSLAPLGKPEDFSQQSRSLRGGMTLHRFRARFEKKTLRITMLTMPDGKLEQYMVAAAE